MISAVSDSSWSRISRSRICACTVASSAVVGSSAMISLGRQRQGHRDHGPLPHAAGELVRVVVHPLPGVRDADPAQQFHGPLLRLGLGRPTGRGTGSSRGSASPPCTAGAGWSAGPGRSPRSPRPGPCAAGRDAGVSRSVPSNMAWPDTWPPGARPSRVWVSTVLPLPDSPTMPSVRPVSTLNDTPRTAFTTPSAVLKLTRRSDTSSRLNACLRVGLVTLYAHKSLSARNPGDLAWGGRRVP